ncbi:MAG: hypothetical protein HY042_06505 [Spirochaetia bacterium]|nr:hypothetical protein [Spirochaetia bacterium]
MKRSRFLLALALPALLFTNCFKILHYLGLNEDGTTSVHWRFTMSKSLADKSKSNAAGSGATGKKEESVEDKLAKSKSEIKQKLQGVSDLKAVEIDNEYEIGIDLQFKFKDPNPIFAKADLDEGFPIVPKMDKASKQMTFAFKPDKEQQKKNLEKKKAASNQPGKPAENKESGDDDMSKGMEEIMGAVLSSAHYQVIFGGKYSPVSAVVRGKTTKTSTPVAITQLDAVYVMDVPFISIQQKEPDGFDVIVTFK